MTPSQKTQNIFLICGYGVPNNIFEDPNYNAYLRPVFNEIYESSLEQKSCIIIASGGHTASTKPYNRSEGEAIVKFLKNLAQRPFVKKQTRSWTLLAEKESLSTLENLLFCEKILKKRKISQANLYVFCEQTRAQRIKILSRKIFSKKWNIKVEPINFDISANHYLDPKFIVTKEKTELQHSLWALENPKNLKEHHRVFEEKFKILRSVDPKYHQESIKKWWTEKLQKTHKA